MAVKIPHHISSQIFKYFIINKIQQDWFYISFVGEQCLPAFDTVVTKSVFKRNKEV